MEFDNSLRQPMSTKPTVKKNYLKSSKMDYRINRILCKDCLDLIEICQIGVFERHGFSDDGFNPSDCLHRRIVQIVDNNSIVSCLDDFHCLHGVEYNGGKRVNLRCVIRCILFLQSKGHIFHSLLQQTSFTVLKPKDARGI